MSLERTQARLDREQRRIEYVRVTPLSDLAEITIRVDQPEPDRSRTEVTYRIVGLSEEANHYVDGFHRGALRRSDR